MGLKSNLAKVLAGTTLIGGIAWGVASWTGTADLTAIKTAYDRALSNISTLTGNIEVYKAELGRRLGLIEDYKTKAESLQAKIDDLEQQLKDAENNSTADSEEISRLETQIADLQAQLDEAITEEQYNQVLAEVERLQGELDKANTEVADLRAYIDGKEATYKDAKAVTSDDLQGETSVEGLYYTWETNTDNTTINDYLNNLKIVDELNESPVTVQVDGTSLNIGNMRAFKKLYEVTTGNNFDTVYAEKIATYKDNTDMTENSKFYNTVSSMLFQITIDNKTYNVIPEPNRVTMTPGGSIAGYETWYVGTAENINF